MSKLFGVNSQAISKHVSNIYKQDELKENSTCSKMEQVQKEGERTIKRTVKFYNLDMIISVGYRVNSKQGIAFRKWATSILKDYVIKGYAVNQKRLEILQKTINLLEEVVNKLANQEKT